jgi:hypothetical protein
LEHLARVITIVDDDVDHSPVVMTRRAQGFDVHSGTPEELADIGKGAGLIVDDDDDLLEHEPNILLSERLRQW